MNNKLVDISRMKHYTHDIQEHCKRVSDLAILICKALKLDKNTLYTTVFAASIHDIGKEYLDQDILNKHGKLTAQEYEHIKRHVYYGAAIAVERGYNIKIARNILLHHENFDGTGYKRLKGKEIPIGSRIIRICDYWDALTSDRPYRRKLSRDEAITLLTSDRQYFDPIIFGYFLNII